MEINGNKWESTLQLLVDNNTRRPMQHRRPGAESDIHLRDRDPIRFIDLIKQDKLAIPIELI